MSNEYMTVTEAAQLLGISLLTLREKLKARGIETIKDPVDTRKRLVLRSDIEGLRALPTSPKTDGQLLAV